MKKIKGPNVRYPKEFGKAIQAVMENMFDFIELSREYDLQSISDEGVTRYLEDDGKTCFQVASQFDRPSEFLQVIIDIIRVTFDSDIPGTFFLNSNIGFLYESIPDKPFSLGYASLVGLCDESFGKFYSGTVEPYLQRCGYKLDEIATMFTVISTGKEHYDMDLIINVAETLGSGFSVEEVFSAFSSMVLDSETKKIEKTCYSGYCLDPVLENKIRLSLLFFIPNIQKKSEIIKIH